MNKRKWVHILAAVLVLLLALSGCGETDDPTQPQMQGQTLPVTQPPAAEPPVTEPPVTQPPAAEPPVTEPPVTQPPVTQPPVTQPPVTEPPATQPQATLPLTTTPPATLPIATQPPATQPPATEPPVTQPPATEPPATEPPVTVPPATEPPVTITPTAAKSVELVKYESADFSLQIPKGWRVTTGGANMYHTIRVQDPSEPLNQMFVLLKAEGLLHSQAGKNAYAFNASIGNTFAQMMADAPVMTNPSTEGFYNLFSEYGAFMTRWDATYAGYSFPRFDNFAVTQRFASRSILSSYAIGEETLRATFTDNGRAGEGMFTASVVDFGSFAIASGWPSGSFIIPTADGGYYMAYNVMAVTAARDTFIEWESVLTQCLGTLEYTESFMKAVKQAGEEQLELAMEISRISNERLEIIMAAWEGRDVQHDITSQKNFDAAGGFERVYNTQTGDVYRASAGWSSTNQSNLYRPVTDDRMYAKPVSGFIR